LDPCTQVASCNFAFFQNLIHYLSCHVDRDGEPYALIPATALARKYGGINPDQIATAIHQRSSRIAGVYRGIGLNKILVIFYSQISPSDCADDAYRY
jgi:hypothetical protein